MRHLSDEDLEILSVFLEEHILSEVRKNTERLETIMSDLDDAVTRITTDIANAVTILQAAIAETAATGADVTSLNAASDALEAALAAATPPAPAPEPAPPTP